MVTFGTTAVLHVDADGRCAVGGWRWLANGNTLMALVTIVVVLPLSCQKHMRSLQNAAAAGMLVVAGLCALLAVKAVSAGMPAVSNGEFELFSFKVCAQTCFCQV